MFSSTRRHISACVLSGVVLAGASPVFAAERADDPPVFKSTFELALAETARFVPAVNAPLFNETSQIPQTGFSVPRTDERGFAAPTLRRSLIVSFAALQVLDAHSTLRALKSGGHEANPAMSGIASRPGALFAVKAGTAAATAYFAERLSKNHPKRAIVLMAILNSAYAAIVAHNYRVARNGR
jgi:hypothetical protein